VGCLVELSTRFPPHLHDLLKQPLARAALAILVIVTIGAASRMERSFAVAVIGCGAFCGLTGVIAVLAGWWSGPAFDMPWPAVGSVYWLGGMGYFAAFLYPYRWLAERSTLRARVAYVTGVLVFVALATYAGDIVCLRLGVYLFQAGYSIAHDVLYGVVLFLSPFLVYDIHRIRSTGEVQGQT